jgi:RNA polymerase sigma-70 factor (ECF subfamily)
MVMDKQQFTDVLENYQSAIISVIYKMIHSWDTAQDLAQESFIKLWDDRGKIREDKPIFKLLYKIAVNQAIEHLRKNKNKYTKLDETIFTRSLNDFIQLLEKAKQQRSQFTLQ